MSGRAPAVRLTLSLPMLIGVLVVLGVGGTTARGLAVPMLLGLPKELPPADVAPRFLLQLDLVQQLAEVVLSVPEVSVLESLKVEDLAAVETGVDGDPTFLTRLPVRVRFASTLRGVTKVFALIDRAKPIIDVSSARVVAPKPEAEPAASLTPPKAEAEAPAKSSSGSAASAEPARLDVDLVVTRYLVTAPQLPADADEPEQGRRKKAP